MKLIFRKLKKRVGLIAFYRLFLFLIRFECSKKGFVDNMTLEFGVCKSVTRQRENSPNILQYANLNRNEDIFNDVTVTAGCECIAANRLILSCHSKFFEAMFKSKMKERYEPSVKIEGADHTALKTLIDYVYTGSIVITESNVMNLLHAADYLQLDDVKDFCFEYLQSITSRDNCFAVLTVANLYRSSNLKNKVYQLISSQFDDIAFTESFKALSLDDVSSCVSNLNRSKTPESSIYRAMITWTKHDDSRTKDFPKLFELLRLYNFPREYLEDVVSNEELITVFPACSKKVLDIFSKLLKGERRKQNATKIVSFGGKRCWNKVSEIYNYFKLSPSKYCDLPFSVEFCSFLEMHNYLFCIGGQTKDQDDKKCASNIVKMMSLPDQQWVDVAPMNEKRYLMGCTVMNDSLVVAGGYSGKTSIASAEFYQMKPNQWKTLASMKHRRCDNALVSRSSIVYALGGWCDGNYLSSVEQLRDFAGSWECFPPMQTPRRWLAAVNCDGIIFAIGGKSGEEKNTRLKSVEKFDFAENKWTYVKEMKYERSALAACVLHGRIFVVGGLDTQEYDSVKEIECYDPSTDTWTVVGSITDELFHHAIFAW